MIGRILAHYEVLEKLGEGGMGEVYKARDRHLDRFVAIKVLPPEKVADPERKHRFVQEAKAASALNHPNIITVHDIDQAEVGGPNGPPILVDFIAMECIEGKTLDELIGRKGLKLNEALKYAVQIADALAKAHAAGIIHRDLKPGNVMVTAEGRVKVLDFGLAKLTERLPGSGEDSTVTEQSLTETGLILGTVSYMSPEQAEGKKVDARSDIFSFGSVLYEMLTGRKPFRRDSSALTLAAILHLEPPPLPAAIPQELERVVSRCLRKDPSRRVQHMDDVKLALEELKEDSDSGKLAGIPATERKRPWRWLWLAAAAALLLAAVLVWRLLERASPADLRAVALTSYPGTENTPSLSPDGNKVAFSWNGQKEDNIDIYVMQIGAAGPPTRLTTSPSAESNPAWSPDDRWIAFTRQQAADNFAIILIASLGGPERRLAEVPLSSRLSWTPDARWLVFSSPEAPTGPSTVWALNVDTGERRRLTTSPSTPAGGGGTAGDTCPSISPDGGKLAFARSVTNLVADVYVLRLTPDLRPEGEPVRVTDLRYGIVRGIAWTADGREIVFGAGGAQMESLWRVPVAGGRAPQRLAYALPAAIEPAIVREPSRLVYSWWLLNTNFWRLDLRTGERKMLIGSTYDSRFPQYSPDGSKIAFQSNRSGNVEVWTCHADGSNCLQITSFDGPQCGSPRWSPDGRWLALDSRAEGQPEIYVVAVDGGAPRRITDHPANDIVPNWSKDGSVYFSSNRSGRPEIWKVSSGGGQPTQLTHDGGTYPFESPDGNHLYYRKPGQPGLFRMPAQGGAEEQVLPAAGPPAVTTKGVYFFGVDNRTIQLLDPATGKASTVATLDKPGYQLTVSPDDAYAVWTQTDRNTQDLMLVENFR